MHIRSVALAYLTTSASSIGGMHLVLCLLLLGSSWAAAQSAATSSSSSIGPVAPCPGAPLQDFRERSTDAAFLEQRGISYAARRDLKDALAYLQRACELAPGTADYVYALGRVQWANGQSDLALQSFDRTLALEPDYVQALLARARLRFKDRASAEHDLDSVDRIAPPKDEVRLDLGLTYEAIGALRPAIHQYDLWLDAHPDDSLRSVGLAARCRARAEADQDLDRALEDCDSALREAANSQATGEGFIRPHPHDNPDVLASRGLVWLRRGEFERAIKDYDDAVDERPKIGEYRFARGLAELRLGRQAKGQADIAAASAIQPDIAERFAAWGLKP